MEHGIYLGKHKFKKSPEETDLEIRLWKQDVNVKLGRIKFVDSENSQH